jgi:hypothetical protein
MPISIDNATNNIVAGGGGQDGDINLLATDGSNRIRLDAQGGNIWVGGNGADGDLLLFASSGDNSTDSEATIHLNGSAGDIILRNADCAEDFPIEDAHSVEPGTVLIIGGDTQLRVCSEAYDKRVAGVVAGAGTYKPGIILGRKEDQLTTSPTPGHAMKAADPMKAFGAVIGKALEPISRRMGMIPILVALQ